MKMRKRKCRFNRTHVVKTFRVTSDYAYFLNRLGTSERAVFFSKALHAFMNNRGTRRKV